MLIYDRYTNIAIFYIKGEKEIWALGFKSVCYANNAQSAFRRPIKTLLKGVLFFYIKST